MIQLRPYQFDMDSRTRDAFRRNRRVLVQGPTGCGKGVLIGYWARGARDKGNQTLMVAHRKEIVSQLVAHVRAQGVKVSMVTDGPPFESCIAGTIGAVKSRLGIIPPPKFLFGDEIHHAPGATFSAILEAYPEAYHLGLTATPQRLDGRGLNEHFDTIVLGPSMRSLIADGWLKKPVYFAPKELVDVSGLRKTAGDFNGADLEALMAKPSVTGNAVAEYKRLCAGRKAMAFCVTVAHAEAVAKAFCEAGIPAVSVDGKLSAEERSARIASFSAGATMILTSCELLGEGYDAPACSAGILLRPTQSLTLFLQQGGRTLRPDPSFQDSIILDHAGNCFRHGFLEDDREWSLEGRPRGAKQEPAIEVHQCLECYAVFQGGECPQCGAGRKPSPREVAAKEGELAELKSVAQKINHRAEERACNSLADWQALAARRGWKPQAAFMRWNCSWKSKRKPKLEKV